MKVSYESIEISLSQKKELGLGCISSYVLGLFKCLQFESVYLKKYSATVTL